MTVWKVFNKFHEGYKLIFSFFALVIAAKAFKDVDKPKTCFTDLILRLVNTPLLKNIESNFTQRYFDSFSQPFYDIRFLP
jgi:hypothetical protein